ncbi:DUF4399 domain-containing protein [Chloroflexi bacterium TSY]|nr:DUF4399 domain-containing protein [Chloroflexi bacterium TSY]
MVKDILSVILVLTTFTLIQVVVLDLRSVANAMTAIRGLEYAYYELDGTLESQTAVKTGSVENLDLSVRQRETNYTLRFTGYLEIPETGDYTFYLCSDSASRFLIGDQQIVMQGGMHADSPEATGNLNLQAGLHPIQLEYTHGEGDFALLELMWSGPGLARTQIPAERLYRDPEGLTVVLPPTPTATPLPTSTATPQLTVTATPPIQSGGDGQLTSLFLPLFYGKETETTSIPQVFFRTPKTGAVVTETFSVTMGSENFLIEPAGPPKEGAGHFHIMINAPCVTPGELIPNDAQHRHFGGGQTEATLTLTPGEHTLCLQVGNGVHTALDLTHIITITVKQADMRDEPRIFFIEPLDGTTVTETVTIKMGAENFLIEPAGSVQEDAGHFHIMIDTPCVGVGDYIPMDQNHRHFLLGQSEAVLHLTPGVHTLCLQGGDGFHQALNLREKITVLVQ